MTYHPSYTQIGHFIGREGVMWVWVVVWVWVWWVVGFGGVGDGGGVCGRGGGGGGRYSSNEGGRLAPGTRWL